MSKVLLSMIINLILETLTKKLGSGALIAGEAVCDEEVEAIQATIPAPLIAEDQPEKEAINAEFLGLAVNAIFDYLDKSMGSKSVLAGYLLKMARGAVLSGLGEMVSELKTRL